MSFVLTATYQKGRQGELEVISELTNKGIEINDFTNYTEHKFKQKKGYDIEVKNTKTNEWDRVDIKTNIRSGNLYLETKLSSTGKLGWFYTSTSDFIYHYDIVNKNLFSYSLKDMRNYITTLETVKLIGRDKNLIALKIVDHMPPIKQIY